VRAIFQISADGSFTVSLQGSTGKPELDEAVLKTLRQWRWQPALRDGVPCPTTQKVRVDFLVD
jgi:protein TonB